MEVLAKDLEILHTEFPGYVLPLERIRLAEPLAAAIDANDEAEALRLLELGAEADWGGPVYAKRSDSRAPLFRAIKRGNPRIVEAILLRGARPGGPDPDDVLASRNQFGQTPLYFAVRCGNREIVDLLLKYGALISRGNGYGKSPLVGAVEERDPGMFAHLLAAGAVCDFEATFVGDHLAEPSVVDRPHAEYFAPPLIDTVRSHGTLMELVRRSDNAELRRLVDEQFRQVSANRPDLQAEVAVRLDDAEALGRLIAAGYDPAKYEPTSSHEGTLRDMAASLNRTACFELLKEAGVEQTRTLEKTSALQLLVTTGAVKELRSRLERGEEFEPYEARRGSPLTLAVNAQQEPMVRFLLERPQAGKAWLADPLLLPAALPYVTNNHGRHRSSAICLAVLKAGAVIRSVPVDAIQPHDNPLVRAAAAGWQDVYQFIAEREPALVHHSQALQAAALANQTAMCRYLLSQGADPDSRTIPHRKSPLEYALFHRNEELMRMLVQADAKKVYPGQFDVSSGYNNFEDYAHPLYHAALAGDTAFCRLLLDEFADADLWQELKHAPYEYDNDIRYFNKGNTLLFAPIYGDHAETLRLLLDHAVRRDQNGQPLLDVNARNAFGATALHEAVIFGAAKCAQLLLANGADVSIPRMTDEQGRGETPLHLASQSVTVPFAPERPQDRPNVGAVFPLLIAAGIRQSGNDLRNESGWLDRRDRHGATALHAHARAGQRDACRKLLSLGADPNAMSDIEETPLVSAIVGDHPVGFVSEARRRHRSRICLDLVEAGASFDGPAGWLKIGYHALGYRFGLYDFCDALRARGVTPDLRANAGEYLCSAVRFRRPDLLKQWIAAGADVNAADSRQNRALLLAVCNHNVELSRVLLAHGADPNLTDKDGRAALSCVFDRFFNHAKRFFTSDPRTAEQAAPVLAQLLLEAGADPRLPQSDDRAGTVLEVFNNMPLPIRQLIEAKLTELETAQPAAEK